MSDIFSRCAARPKRAPPLPFLAVPVQIPPMGIQQVRLSETVRYLNEQALDALVAVNYGHNSFLESHAVFVLSSVRPIGESAVVVDRAGASTLIVTPAWDAGLGAEDNFLLLSASQHNLAVRAAGGRVLDVGDIILSEITPCYRGQFAQICRTTVIGKPTPLMQEKYAILQTAMRAGQKAAVPGT